MIGAESGGDHGSVEMWVSDHRFQLRPQFLGVLTKPQSQSFQKETDIMHRKCY